MKLIKPIAVICASFLLVTALYSEESTTVDSNYDAELAKKLGGDQYGMKNYVLVLLKTGPKDGEVTGQARADIFSGDMKNIGRLADEGKLAVAGPFGKNEQGMRGLIILNVATPENIQADAGTGVGPDRIRNQ